MDGTEIPRVWLLLGSSPCVFHSLQCDMNAASIASALKVKDGIGEEGMGNVCVGKAEALPETLSRILKAHGPELLVYNAGTKEAWVLVGHIGPLDKAGEELSGLCGSKQPAASSRMH